MRFLSSLPAFMIQLDHYDSSCRESDLGCSDGVHKEKKVHLLTHAIEVTRRPVTRILILHVHTGYPLRVIYFIRRRYQIPILRTT